MINPNHYDKSTVFTRFTNLIKHYQEDLEESKEPEHVDHGLELWGLGYVTSDHSEDLDSDDNEDEEDYAYNEDMKRKILTYATTGGQVEFEIEEF